MDVELIELLVDVENLVNWNWILIMWIVIEKWWIDSEYDELLENWLNCVCVENYVIEKDVEKWDEEWDVELLMMKEWIELLRLLIWDCDELDWDLLIWNVIVELCELHVFDGNELIILNGWLICVNQEKRDEIESICYMMRWEIGQCEIAPNEWYEKKRKIDIEKDAQKGKMIDIKKRCPNGKRLWWDWWKGFT